MDGERRDADNQFLVVAVAASAGGFHAITQVLLSTSEHFSAAIVIVQHRSPEPGQLAAILTHRTNRLILDAVEGDRLIPGCIFLAPPGQHLLINPGGTLSVTRTEKLNFHRPSADLLFRSGAEHLGARLIAVVLTGYLSDGADGIRHVHRRGGRVIAQDRGSSEVYGMPASAEATGCVDWVLPLDEIGPALNHLAARGIA